jgi:hypothetical protein
MAKVALPRWRCQVDANSEMNVEVDVDVDVEVEVGDQMRAWE